MIINRIFAFCFIHLFLVITVAFGQPPCRECRRSDGKINQPADVTDVQLSKEKIILPCRPGTASKSGACDDDGMTIEVVVTKAEDKENDPLTYGYIVSGGRIIGSGSKVTWDLGGLSPGTYTITVAVDDGCGFCGKAVTKTVTVMDCPDCEQSSPCSTPIVSVFGPSNVVKVGETATITADVVGGNNLITYNWTVSNGTIASGQGTPVITVDTKGLETQDITATVKILGGCEPVTVTYSFSVLAQQSNIDRPNISGICGAFISDQLREQEQFLPFGSDFPLNEPIGMLVLAGIHYEKEEYDSALSFLNQILEQNQNDREVLNPCVLNIIGAIYSNTGNYQNAIATYRKILPLAIKHGQSRERMAARIWKATAEANIGLAYVELKQYSKAIPLFEGNIKILAELKDDYTLATVLNFYGTALREMKLYKRATETHQRALKLAKSINNQTLIADIYEDLGRDALAQNRINEAIRIFKESLIYFDRRDDSFGRTETLLDLMNILKKDKQPNLAIFYGKQGINGLQKVRRNIKSFSKPEQQKFLKSKAEHYHTLAQLLIEMGRVAEAEAVLAMLKEEELLEFVRRDDGVARDLKAEIRLSREEEEAFQEYEKYADEITRIGAEFSPLEKRKNDLPLGESLPPEEQKQYDALKSKLDQANTVFYKFLEDLKVKFGQTDVRVAALESDTQGILKRLDQPRTVIISTIVGADRLNLIVTTSGTQRAHTVRIKEAEVNTLVVEFRQAVKNSAVDPRLLGKKLFDILFPAALQKDLDNIQAETIIWSLDGTLRYLPLAALWDGQKYLAERYTNAVLTLASRDKINDSVSDRRKWQVFGVGVSKGVTLTNRDGSTVKFSTLSAVPKELCSIVSDPNKKAFCETAGIKQNGLISGLMLPDEDFTINGFENNLGRTQVVHIASHFSLNPGNESDSYLLVGGGAERRFSLTDLRKTRLDRVDLLVLSACNTAMTAGNSSRGVEIEGFGALSQNQGAKTVLATLWAVADESTKDLMTEFYRILAANPQLGKAEALRQAQLKLMYGPYTPEEALKNRNSEVLDLSGKQQPPFKRDQKAPYAHPFFWSPFVLYGNWR